MRRVAIAEWILSCTMPQERAGAAAGDLAEVSGELSFWTGLSRCVVSASFRNLAEAPLSFLWTALLLWSFLVASAIYAFCGWLAWPFLYVFDHHTALELIADIPSVPPTGLARFVGLVLLPPRQPPGRWGSTSHASRRGVNMRVGTPSLWCGPRWGGMRNCRPTLPSCRCCACWAGCCGCDGSGCDRAAGSCGRRSQEKLSSTCDTGGNAADIPDGVVCGGCFCATGGGG